jgi:hypothetical protein
MRHAELMRRHARHLRAHAAMRECWAETPVDMAVVLRLERRAAQALAEAEQAEQQAQQGPTTRQQAALALWRLRR